MTDSRSELMALADKIEYSVRTMGYATIYSSDLIVSALRLAASQPQPDREAIARIIEPFASGYTREWHDAVEKADAILLLLVGGDQKETQTTKPSPSRAEDSASETATEAERERCAAIVQMARFGEIDQDFRAIISIIEGGMTIEQIKEFCA